MNKIVNSAIATLALSMHSLHGVKDFKLADAVSTHINDSLSIEELNIAMLGGLETAGFTTKTYPSFEPDLTEDMTFEMYLAQIIDHCRKHNTEEGLHVNYTVNTKKATHNGQTTVMLDEISSLIALMQVRYADEGVTSVTVIVVS